MKTLLTLTLLISLSASGQEWYKITGNDVAVIATQALAGSADAVNQMIIHHRYRIDEPFWNNKTSLQRKYKSWPEDKSAAYPFSKNLLAWTTDGYHLTRFIDRTATLATIGITAGDWSRWPKKDRWKFIAKKIVLSAVANRAMFLIIYK
mgnify:CR=1 FL=1